MLLKFILLSFLCLNASFGQQSFVYKVSAYIDHDNIYETSVSSSLNATNLNQPTDCDHYAMEQAAAEYEAGLFDDEWDSLDSYLYHLDICERFTFQFWTKRVCWSSWTYFRN